jgi:putative NIF3 family GTP cyclohydrolase 1 type 2
MTVRELDEFFVQLDPSKRKPGGRDGLKWGNPDAEVQAVGTTWMATMDVLQRAAQLGCNVIVTHEPTFYWDDVGTQQPEYEIAAQGGTPTDAKRRFLDQHGMAILRIHDLWDGYPEWGIAASLARLLNWGTRVSEPGQVPIFQVRPVPLGEVARYAKLRLRLRAVRVVGDLSQEVSKIALAVGAFGGLPVVQEALQLGADCLLGGECSEWQVVRFCQDINFGLVLLGHCESEEPGMAAMAAFLRAQLNLPAHHIPAAPTFVYV